MRHEQAQFPYVIMTREINRLSRDKETSVGNWATMLLTLYKLTRINFCDETLIGQLTWLEKKKWMVCFGFMVATKLRVIYKCPQCVLKALDFKDPSMSLTVYISSLSSRNSITKTANFQEMGNKS